MFVLCSDLFFSAPAREDEKVGSGDWAEQSEEILYHLAILRSPNMNMDTQKLWFGTGDSF